MIELVHDLLDWAVDNGVVVPSKAFLILAENFHNVDSNDDGEVTRDELQAVWNYDVADYQQGNNTSANDTSDIDDFSEEEDREYHEKGRAAFEQMLGLIEAYIKHSGTELTKDTAAYIANLVAEKYELEIKPEHWEYLENLFDHIDSDNSTTISVEELDKALAEMPFEDREERYPPTEEIIEWAKEDL